MAAYIDADGCIDIHLHKSTVGGELAPRHLLQIAMTNCDPRLIVWCKTTFSCGTICVRRRGGKHRTNYVWACHSKKAQTILEGCLPYFIVKREQAEVALAFRKTITRGRGGVARNIPLAPSVYAQRVAFKVELSRLKHMEMEMSSGRPN